MPAIGASAAAPTRPLTNTSARSALRSRATASLVPGWVPEQSGTAPSARDARPARQPACEWRRASIVRGDASPQSPGCLSAAPVRAVATVVPLVGERSKRAACCVSQERHLRHRVSARLAQTVPRGPLPTCLGAQCARCAVRVTTLTVLRSALRAHSAPAGALVRRLAVRRKATARCTLARRAQCLSLQEIRGRTSEQMCACNPAARYLTAALQQRQQNRTLATRRVSSAWTARLLS